MLTFFLALFVLLINVSTHLFQISEYYPAVSHCYYAVMVARSPLHKTTWAEHLLGITTVANWIYVFRYPNHTENIIIALLYPFVAYGVYPYCSALPNAAAESGRTDRGDKQRQRKFKRNKLGTSLHFLR